MRGKECKPGERASRLASAQPNTTALERVLLYRGGHGLIAANGGACPEGRRAGKQRASLQFVAHHLTLSTSQVSLRFVINSAVSRAAASSDRRRNRDRARRRGAARGGWFRGRRSSGRRRGA